MNRGSGRERTAIENRFGRRLIMKKKAILAFSLGILFLGGALFGAQTHVVFELSLYKAVPANGTKVFIRWTTADTQAGNRNAAYFYTSEAVHQGQGENEIKRVFRVQDLERTAATRAVIQYNPDMIGDRESNDYFSGWWEGYYGMEGPLLEVSLSDGKKYGIRIIPLDVANVPYRFRLQIHEPTSKPRYEGSHGILGGSTPQHFYVDVEFSLPIGDTSVIGFADSKDTPYFLSITLDAIGSGKTNAKTETPIGGPVGGLLEESKAAAAAPVEVKSGEIKAGQPETIRTIAPEYPESCRSKGIEGSVGLEVSVDAEGRPTDVRVVKSAHPDLDKAAVVAVRQWLFKPFMVAGKAKAVVYAMTVDFKKKDAERK
jgi:TonB family protein